MIEKKEEFDLSKFLNHSLCLQENIIPHTRKMFQTVQEDPLLRLVNKDPFEVLGLKSFDKPSDISKHNVGTPIQEFYRGLNLFITGGTGFIGKVLTEKLLRSIPHLNHIYLMIRSKRGKSSWERFVELMEDQVFLRVKTEVPNYHTKITVIDGDLSEPGLGLTAADQQILSSCIHVVFHSAADVRFIEPLRGSISSNVLGTKRVLELAKGMKNIKSFILVSTAYSFCVNRVIEEKCYKLPMSYKEILNYIASKSDEELEKETDKIMQGWPNSYTFSKAICEVMVQEEAEGLPICIFRPSVVWPTCKEPLISWTDNVYGPNGMLLAVGLGVLHIFKINQELTLDVVPVDFVVNSMIAAAWNTAQHRCGSLPVYNYTSTPQNPMVWKELSHYGRKWKDAYPFENAVWYMSFCHTENTIVQKLGYFFLHKIPGLVIDGLAKATGRKPRLTKIYNKIALVLDKLEYFLFGIWEFKNDNVTFLWNKLSKEDKKIFYFDIMDMDLEKYSLVGKLGIRYFYLKEKMETLPAAQRKWTWLKWAHNTLLLVTGFVALKVLVSVARVLPI